METTKEPKDNIKEIDQQNRERLLSSDVHEVRTKAEKIFEQVDYQKSTGTVDNRTRELRAEIQLLLNYLDTYK